jgi:hypothetical protein
MALRVREDQRGTPRPAVQQPPLDPEVLAKKLHVGDQVRGGVHAHIGGRVARVRGAAPTAALVEQHHAVATGVERTPLPRRAPGPGAAVHHE